MSGMDGNGCEALEVRQSAPKQLRTVLGLVAFLGLFVLAGVTGAVDTRLVLLGCAVFGALAILGFVLALRARGAPWELKLDAAGVTVRGHDRVRGAISRRCGCATCGRVGSSWAPASRS